MGRYTAGIVVLPEFDERASLVFDKETGIPADLPSSYLVLNEFGHLSHNTMHFRAIMIAQLFNWADKRHIDFNNRFASGEGFSMEEILSLNDYLTRDHSNAKVKPLRVAVKTHSKKIAVATSFLAWMRDRYYLQRRAGDVINESMKERTNIVIDRLLGKVVKGESNTQKGLTIEEQQAFLQVIAADNPDSPFKGYNRERNYLLFLMLFISGVRISELLKLTLMDLQLEGSNPFIHVSHEEHVPDPRKNKMVLKTQPRDIQISGDMVRLIQQFLLEGRQFRKAARKAAPFLFLNSRIDTKAMSRNQVYNIVQLIRAAHPLLHEVSPHRLRHTWNDNFDRMYKDSGMTDVMKTRTKNYLCGWVPTSKQSEKYNILSVMELSQKLSLDLQANMFKKLRGG